MSTVESSLIPTNLAQVIDRIATRDDIPRQRRHELTSAVRVMSRLIALPPAEIAADPEALRAKLKPMTAASAGLSPPRWRNLKSLFHRALVFTGVACMGRRSRAVLSTRWRELLGRV